MQHRAERAMTPTTVRAGSSSGTMWLGGVLAFAGLMTALSSTAMFVQGEPLGAVVTVLVGVVMLMGGVALFLLAKRAWARIDGRGVSWSTMLGARGFVAWEHVHHVSVPGMGDPGGAVLLWLHDGSVVPIAPLRRTQGADDNTGPHPWYLRAGSTVVRAHQQWLAAHAARGRAGGGHGLS